MSQTATARILLGFLAFTSLATISVAADKSKGVQITDADGKVRVEINGELFTEYVYQGAPHVYYYPVLGPGGLKMTRDFPMVPDSVGEDHDHKHQRSMWYSHGEVNGIDFWSEEARAGKIVHDKFLELKSGEESGVIRSTCKWIAPDDSVVCTDERTFRIYNRPDKERLFDFEVTVKAGEKPVVFGDTKEGSFGIRIAESMRLSHGKNKPGEGKIVLSSGDTDDKAWGKHAEWCDYYGPVQGKTVGIAIFDNPQNPRHPTTWHVRDYGLFAANPFGLHDFEKKPKNTGDLTIEPGKSVTFRYRVYMHEGNTKQAQVAERYKDYSGGK
ncbi:MAG: Transrane protein [Verrucomicrobiales bacterium]|nr:Transrane protein [Verrucomicrobiales bacterium]